MPRDYAKRRGGASAGRAPAKRARRGSGKPANRRRKPAPAFSTGSFIGGIAVGCVLTLIAVLGPAYLESDYEGQMSGAPAPPEPAPQPRFEFWDRLPEGEVAADTQPYKTLGESNAPKGPREYLLQAGSFKRRTDADSLRAALLLEGLDVETTEVALGGDDRWYRVLVGPFPSKLETQRVMTQLRERNIAPLLLERTPSAG